MFSWVFVLFGQAEGSLALGNYAKARTAIEEGLAIAQDVNNPYLLALAINVLGDLERFEGNYERAQAAHEQSLAGLRQIGAARGTVDAGGAMSFTRQTIGDRESSTYPVAAVTDAGLLVAHVSRPATGPSVIRLTRIAH